MDLIKILRSLEEFLFEVISWLLFFPLTLWRVIRRPLRMADYAVRELDESEESRFSDSVSPPMFLILAVIIAHALELQLHAMIPGPSNALGRMLVGNEQSLLLFRAVAYSLLPLAGSVAYLRGSGQPFDRETVRRPFFALCLLTGPFAIVFSSGSALSRHADGAYMALGTGVMLAAMAWYLAVQARWFSAALKVGLARGLWIAGTSFVLGAALATAFGAALLT